MKDKLKLLIEKPKNFFSKEGLKAFFADKTKRKRFIWISSALIITLATVIFCAVYVGDYYRADGDAIAVVSGQAGSLEIYDLQKGVKVFEPCDAKAGFIFYPGGKVEYTAYQPLMEALAARGILTVLCEMPFNLAVLDMAAAKGINEEFPHIENWYIGGHSLGGSMAASYLSGNTDSFDGLVLLGSYSTSNLTDSRVLSIYGSEDGVMNRQKYEKYKKNLPKTFTEFVIDGGNHAYFGMYGEQKGDGKALITPIEQIVITADAISDFIYSN